MDVRLHIMRTLLDTGRAPTADETAAELGLTRADVEERYRELAASHAIELRPGSLEVWMAHPLSAEPTPFVATVEGRDHFTCGAPGWEAVAHYALEWSEEHAPLSAGKPSVEAPS